MKELFFAILALVAAIAISVVQLPLGILYGIGHAIFMTVKGKRPWYQVFKKLWKILDGTLAAIAHGVYYVAEMLDIMWNVNGEILEDMVTSAEDTYFGDKRITVSATMGNLKARGLLNAYGRFCTKVLNIAFQQKDHTGDAWIYTQARWKLKETLFKK